MRFEEERMATRQKLNISRWAIRHPRITIGFWIAVIAAGLLAFGSLKYALFPDITFPVVVVNAQSPSPTSAEVTEQTITLPIEESLKQLKGLDDIVSRTNTGNATIKVSFQVGKNLTEAKREVLEAINKSKLPVDAQVGTISLNLNESTAVEYVVKSRKMTLNQLTKITEREIIPKLQKVKGVLSVRLLGLESNETGQSKDQNFVRSPATAVRLNMEESLAIQVVKKGNANTLDLVHDTDKVVDKVQKRLENVEIIQAATQANYIQEASHATIESIGIAVALSAIIIYPFLWNWKATFISALAIPTSLFGTFIVMALFGLKLETITMLAIALVVGIIVDDAIVDVENISRHLELGENPRRATISATDEVGLTLTAATLTIAAVFIPVATMGGVVGEFFRPFGITASAAVLISLLVSRTLSPLLSMYWLRKQPKGSDNNTWDQILRWYKSRLELALQHRKIVLLATMVSIAVGIGLVSVVNKGFIPKLDRGEFMIAFTSEQQIGKGIGKESQKQEVASISNGERAIESTKEDSRKIELLVKKTPEVKDIFTKVGDEWGQVNKGELVVKLRKVRDQTTSVIQEKVRSNLNDLSRISTSVEDIPFVDTGNEKPIQISVQGNDLTMLEKTTNQVIEKISMIPGIVDISSQGTGGKSQGRSIEHLNGKRVSLIEANISEKLTAGEATKLIRDKTVNLVTEKIKLVFNGDSARIKEIMGSFALTMSLGISCILLVLLLLFKNLSDPLIIVISLPLSLIGAIGALIIAGQEFSVISAIGIIFLMGLTNKNAIIMVDYINQLRQSGKQTRHAILEGATVRLRPILMTTGATVLGMLPIAIGAGAGSELRSPMAIAIMGGLLTSTILSLFVIPVVYSLMAELKLKLNKTF
jgi:multidrug efflux pump subunit AcrB